MSELCEQLSGEQNSEGSINEGYQILFYCAIKRYVAVGGEQLDEKASKRAMHNEALWACKGDRRSAVEAEGRGDV